jgi:bifunctional DNase/RNase
MIRVVLETLVMGNIPGASLLILRPVASEPTHDRILPICIGPVEAAAIGKALSDEKDSRPMTHSLLCTVMGTLGGKLVRISIPRVKGTIFYATLHIKQGDAMLKIDARPSDAVALAIRMNVPMYVSESVMASAGYPAWVNIKSEQDKEEIEQFHEFVESVTPDDFKTH